MLARFSLDTFSIPARVVHSQLSENTRSTSRRATDSSFRVKSCGLPYGRFAGFEVNLRAGQLRERAPEYACRNGPSKLDYVSSVNVRPSVAVYRVAGRRSNAGQPRLSSQFQLWRSEITCADALSDVQRYGLRYCPNKTFETFVAIG
jgi:hypothetical protein